VEAERSVRHEIISVGNLVKVDYLGYILLGIVTRKENGFYKDAYHYDIFVFEFPWKTINNRTIGRSIKDIKEVLA
jgi:hypothetical protein